MRDMHESMTHSGERSPTSELPGWKTAASAVAGLLLAVLFILSGTWKITDPFSWAQRIAQLRVSANLSLATACFFGVAETYAGVLVLVSAFSPLGRLVVRLSAARLHGLHRLLLQCAPRSRLQLLSMAQARGGAGIFRGRRCMLGLAVIAGWWAKPSSSLPSAALVLMAVVVFAGVSLGVSAQMQSTGEGASSHHGQWQAALPH